MGFIKDTGLQMLSFLPHDDFSFLSREGSMHVGMCRKSGMTTGTEWQERQLPGHTGVQQG